MAPVPPKLQLAFDIFAATNVATNDPVGKRSAATLTTWLAGGKVKLTSSGIVAMFMGYPGALTQLDTFITSDTITVYEDVMDAAKGDALAYGAMLIGHEGVHAAMRSLDLDSEVVAWSLQLDVYKELCSTPVSVGGVSYGVTVPSKFSGLIDAEAARGRNQLIDWILLKNSAYQVHVDAPWIFKHLAHWGGLANRKPEVIEIYLSRICKPPLVSAGQGLDALVLLERVLPSMASPAARLKVVESVGQPLREALRLVVLGTRDGARRVAALEAASGIKFRALSSNPVYYQMEKALGL